MPLPLPLPLPWICAFFELYSLELMGTISVLELEACKTFPRSPEVDGPVTIEVLVRMSPR